MTTERLRAENGRLYFRDMPLLCIYPAGDCDSIKWPLSSWKNLVSALYDLGNTDYTVYVDGVGFVETKLQFPLTIELPDGTVAGELVRCGFNPVCKSSPVPETQND